MQIDNFKVYDLEESVVASGFPMLTEYSTEGFRRDVGDMAHGYLVKSSDHYKRACKLADNAPGTGHNNFLSGILVAANVTATQVWWMQMERYHFVQIVSMQSKMHRLRVMMEKQIDCFHEKTDAAKIDEFHVDATTIYDDEQLVYNCPMGLELTARITTNYLALKTIWNQRHNHKLEEWREFCRWIERLPFAKGLSIGDER